MCVAQSIGNTANNTVQMGTALIINKPAIANNSNYRLINNEPGNANAWLQLYLWLTKTKEEQIFLQQTLQSAKQYIGQSWQLSLMQFIASGKKDLNAIQYAIDHAENKALIYPYAIHYAIINNKKDLLKEYAIALNNLAPIPALLYEYHYNALVSAAPDAKIYGKGLTDLAPMAILQQVYNIRPDIELKYYEGEIRNSANTYICLSAGKEIIERYPDADYSGLLINLSYSGLLINLSSQNNMEAVENSLKYFSLQKLLTAVTLTEEESGFYKNYIPSFVLMYKWSKNMQQLDKAEKWKNYLQKIGTLTGSTKAIEKAIED